ncbi:NADP-dependent oxidoreductase [Aureivirga sp. CE67]|uniref:NADP-dependent oxidoreductase n=1 Tax=Aureivirga sp. CE67 TaxID=1788983 RepID=UPI0018CB64DB|nr:NADP-dependent oxidoreductase [Aureivirga sp. CE67]
MENKQYILKERPYGDVTNDTFHMRRVSMPSLREGEVMVKTKYISVDPYMRGKMNEQKTYTEPYVVGKAIYGAVVGEVVKSKDKSYQPGDFVHGIMPWQEYCSIHTEDVTRVNVPKEDLPMALSVLGMTGLTAYFGMMKIGKPREGETVVISGAAGAVGTVAGQIAKLHGCRVIGISSSEIKNHYLENDLGFDDTINYLTTDDLDYELSRKCPDGIDIYFDNVGGKISDTIMEQMNFFSRVIVCGQISTYNSKEKNIGLRIQPMILTRSMLMQGFIVSNYHDEFPKAQNELAKWISEGKIKNRETIINGFENLPRAFMGLFRGANIGKQLVKVY